MHSSMRTYGSTLTLSLSEDKALENAKKHLLSQEDIFGGEVEIDTEKIQAAASLDQLFSVFDQVLRRSVGDAILGTSGLDTLWVNPRALFESLQGAFEVGSWYAYKNEFFDCVLLFQEDGLKEYFYEIGVVDPQEAPYRDYPHGISAPDPGKGDMHQLLTRVIRHWIFTHKVNECQTSFLTVEEASSFLADTDSKEIIADASVELEVG